MAKKKARTSEFKPEVKGEKDGIRGTGAQESKCGKCGARFVNRTELGQHYKAFPSHRTKPIPRYVLSGRNKVCKKCGQTFDTTSALRRHHKENPSHAKKYNQSFDKQDTKNMNKTNSKEDKEVAARTCKTCHEVFPSVHYLHKHHREHPDHRAISFRPRKKRTTPAQVKFCPRCGTNLEAITMALSMFPKGMPSDSE